MVLWNTCGAARCFLYSCCHAVHPPPFKIPGSCAWILDDKNMHLACASPLLIALKHSKPCSVGKVAFEVMFSLWRLLKGHLREVPCLFLWELFSSGGERLWRCRQQRLPLPAPSHKASAAVVVTEKTLQAYCKDVTCEKENPFAKSE